MRLNGFTYLVGSGRNGFDLTDPTDCHVYLLDGGTEAALVDCGAGLSVSKIVENVKGSGVPWERVRYVILTHSHADHAGGALELRQRYGLQVIASKKTAQRLAEDAEPDGGLEMGIKAGWYPRDYRLNPCPVDWTVEEGFRIQVGSLTLEVMETPGHSPDHISLLIQKDGLTHLFGGDLLFHGGKVALLSSPDCHWQDYIASLRRLRQVRIDALYPWHNLITLQYAQRHVVKANQYLDNLSVPPSVW